MLEEDLSEALILVSTSSSMPINRGEPMIPLLALIKQKPWIFCLAFTLIFFL
jgi:hypothetical protein